MQEDGITEYIDSFITNFKTTGCVIQNRHHQVESWWWWWWWWWSMLRHLEEFHSPSSIPV